MKQEKYEQLKKTIQHSKQNPIRLADVLLAIKKYYLQKNLNSKEVQTVMEGVAGKLLRTYELSNDDLDHQSDETKEFVMDILL
jgi:hypothetical protein